ncbi:MAG: hypothetical protein HY961_12025 [Ignavibacteriae bacterium]|nr:hypothetical protein [Ignavibacteriota bacterium]
MNKSFVLVTVLLVLCFSASGQDFKKVVDIVVDIESTLKQKIASEETQRKQDMAALKSEVESLRSSLAMASSATTSSPPAADPAATAALEKRLDALEKLVVQQEKQDIGALAGQLNTLLGELKKTIADAKAPDVAKPATPPTGPTAKVGFLAQVHGQTLEEQTTAKQDADPTAKRHWQRQLYVRRLRVLVGGEIGKNTSFFFESDAPNIGKVEPNGTKSAKVQMYVQDAQVQHVVVPEFSIIAGLQLVGLTRNSLQSAASLMALDYGAYQFSMSTPLDNNVGRDLGVNFRGFVGDERLEYRAGVFSGRNVNAYSPLRLTTRVNYAFKDKEKGIFYSGTTLGKSEILSLGGGFDLQGSYQAFAVDGFADMPFGSLGSFTLSLSYSALNGGGSDADSTYFTGLIPKQNILFAEAGYFFKDLGLQPYARFESQTVNASVLKQVNATPATLGLQNSLRSSKRYGLGLNYYLSGHNLNVKMLYEVVVRNRLSADPTKTETASNGQLTIQMQYFTF